MIHAPRAAPAFTDSGAHLCKHIFKICEPVTA